MSEIIRLSNSPHYLPRICDILRRYHLLVAGWHHELHYVESYQKVPVNESLKNSQCWYLNIVRESKKCQLRALMKPNLHDKNPSSLNTYQSNSLTMRNINFYVQNFKKHNRGSMYELYNYQFLVL